MPNGEKEDNRFIQGRNSKNLQILREQNEKEFGGSNQDGAA